MRTENPRNLKLPNHLPIATITKLDSASDKASEQALIESASKLEKILQKGGDKYSRIGSSWWKSELSRETYQITELNTVHGKGEGARAISEPQAPIKTLQQNFLKCKFTSTVYTFRDSLSHNV